MTIDLSGFIVGGTDSKKLLAATLRRCVVTLAAAFSPFDGIQNERRVTKSSVVIAAVETLRAVDHAAFGIPFVEIELAAFNEVFE